MRTSIALALIAAVAVVLIGSLNACGCAGPSTVLAAQCLSQTKQMALAMRMYADDNNDHFQPAQVWMDSIQPYVRLTKFQKDVFHAPELKADQYGYAFNSELAAKETPHDGKNIVAVFESSKLTRNTVDPVASLPNPGRHVGKSSVAYADGHARRIERP